MAIYEYECAAGHRRERIRKYEARDEAVECLTCGGSMHRVVSLPHCVPDGMYSYAPNVGNADAFEKRRIAMREGQRLIKKSDLLPGT